jgi:type II secretory pathway pseudopilin PulG
MRGQISTELMVIVALVLLIFIPLLVLVYFKANEANQQIAAYQAELAVFRIAYLANAVGSLGTNTSVTTDVYLPQNLMSFWTNSSGMGGEMDMQVNTPQGPSDIVEIVDYPVANPGILANQANAGGQIKLLITSQFDTNTNKALLSITKVSG